MNPSKLNIHTLHFQVVFPFFDPPKEHTSIIIILRHVKASSAANSGVLDNKCVCDVHIMVSGCVCGWSRGRSTFDGLIALLQFRQ